MEGQRLSIAMGFKCVLESRQTTRDPSVVVFCLLLIAISKRCVLESGNYTATTAQVVTRMDMLVEALQRASRLDFFLEILPIPRAAAACKKTRITHSKLKVIRCQHHHKACCEFFASDPMEPIRQPLWPTPYEYQARCAAFSRDPKDDVCHHIPRTCHRCQLNSTMVRGL